MEYDVRITVVKEITIPVVAPTMESAKAIAEQRWGDNEFTLAPIKSQKVKFETLYPELGRFHDFNDSQSSSHLSLMAAEKVNERLKWRIVNNQNSNIPK